MADKTDELTITFEGKSYTLEDFELGELEWLEEQLGFYFNEIGPGGSPDANRAILSMKASVHLVYVIKKRDDPKFTLGDARKVKLSVFATPNENGKPAKARPTKAAKAAARSRT